MKKDDLDTFYQAMAWYEQYQASIQKALASYQRLYEKPMMDSLRSLFEQERAITKQLQALEASWREPLAQIEEQMRQAAQIQTSLAQQVEVFQSTTWQLKYEPLLSTIGKSLEETVFASQRAIASALAKRNLASHGQMVGSAIGHLVEFERFSDRTVRALQRAIEIPEKRMLLASVDVASIASGIISDHVVRTTASLEIEETEEATTPPMPRCSIFGSIQREFRVRLPNEPELLAEDDVLSELKTTSTLSMQVEVLGRTIISCDEASRYVEQPIFGTSFNYAQIMFQLPGTVAWRKEDFGNWIGLIYWLVWECAGKTQGLLYELLTEDEKAFIDEIRLLRDNFCQHPIEQERDPESKMAELKAFFGRVVDKALPAVPEDWLSLQHYVVMRLADMLSRVDHELRCGIGDQ